MRIGVWNEIQVVSWSERWEIERKRDDEESEKVRMERIKENVENKDVSV